MANQRMSQGVSKAEAKEINRIAQERGYFAESKPVKKTIRERTAQALRTLSDKSNTVIQKSASKVRSQDARANSRTRSFSGAVESQNVQGIIKSVESRGMHDMVRHDPFSPPPKEVERDRNGFLRVKNSIWG